MDQLKNVQRSLITCDGRGLSDIIEFLTTYLDNLGEDLQMVREANSTSDIYWFDGQGSAYILPKQNSIIVDF